jgi:hypothetical protein
MSQFPVATFAEGKKVRETGSITGVLKQIQPRTCCFPRSASLGSLFSPAEDVHSFGRAWQALRGTSTPVIPLKPKDGLNGAPSIGYRCGKNPLFHHHRSATAWLIAIKEKGQRHHQDRGKAKHIIDVHISQGLGLRLKVVVQLPLGQV